MANDDGLEVDRAPAPTPAAPSSAAMPGPRRGAERSQAEPGDGPVLADDRRDVRDGADGREVRELEAAAGPPGRSASSSCATLKATPLPGEPAVGIPAVRPMRVDDGQRPPA